MTQLFVNPDYNGLPPGFGTTSGANFDQSWRTGAYAAPAGGGGIPPATGGAAQIQTSIKPQTLFSKGLTQRTANQAIADRQRSANWTHAQKQFDRPGVSRGDGSQYRAAPQVAQGLTQAAMAGGQIPWDDEAANQQFLMQGQVARAGEFNQLADLLMKLQGLSNYTGQQNVAALAPIFSLFGRFA